MPWQLHVADVALELLPDGRPAYRDVVLTVPRQNGKTVLLLAVMIQRALGWSYPQRIVYSAQTGNDARKKLVEDWSPVLDRKRARLQIRRVLKGMGNEAVDFRNGSRVVLLASSEDSGHGKTVDLAIHDEIFADSDDRREQATIPAMATRSLAQQWCTSTMGTDDSVFLNRKVELGRAAVEEGVSQGIAFFEWSAPEDADIDDPATWSSCMPALGLTINDEVVLHARRTMPEGEFRRAFLNQRTTSDERVIPVAEWSAVQDDSAAPEGQLLFGLDCNPERTWASIAVAGGGALEVVAHRPGVGWLLEEASALGDGVSIAVDPGGPAGVFIPSLRDRGLDVVEVGGRDLVQACGGFFDDVIDRKIRVRPHPGLDAAVSGASKRMAGDAWVWSRKSSDVDISPLVASTVAWWWRGLALGDPVQNIW